MARSSRNPPTAVIKTMINTPEPSATRRNNRSVSEPVAERLVGGVSGDLLATGDSATLKLDDSAILDTLRLRGAATE